MFDQHIHKLHAYTPDMARFLYATMRTCPMCKNFFEQDGGQNLDEIWTMWGETHKEEIILVGLFQPRRTSENML